MAKLKQLQFLRGFRIDVIESWSDNTPACLELPDRVMVSEPMYQKIMSGEVAVGDLEIKLVIDPQMRHIPNPDFRFTISATPAAP